MHSPVSDFSFDGHRTALKRQLKLRARFAGAHQTAISRRSRFRRSPFSKTPPPGDPFRHKGSNFRKGGERKAIPREHCDRGMPNSAKSHSMAVAPIHAIVHATPVGTFLRTATMRESNELNELNEWNELNETSGSVRICWRKWAKFCECWQLDIFNCRIFVDEVVENKIEGLDLRYGVRHSELSFDYWKTVL